MRLKLLRYTWDEVLVPSGIVQPGRLLGYLILPPFCQPWSSGYGSSKCPLSYVSLLGPIYQHAVSITQYLLDEAKGIRSLIDTDGSYYLRAPNINIPLNLPFR
jgi:hypothetical protein